MLRPSAFDLVLINMAGGDDPGKYKLKQCTLHNDTNASDRVGIYDKLRNT